MVRIARNSAEETPNISGLVETSLSLRFRTKEFAGTDGHPYALTPADTFSQYRL